MGLGISAGLGLGGTSGGGGAFTTTSQTASTSASIEFDVSTGSYEFDVYGAYPATNDTYIGLEVYAGSWQTTGYDAVRSHSDGAGSGQNQAATNIPCSIKSGNTNVSLISFNIKVGGLDSTTGYKQFHGSGSNYAVDNQVYTALIGGCWTTATAITKVRFRTFNVSDVATGNIEAGTFKMRAYGAN